MYFKTKDERIFDLDPSKVFIQEELINKVLRYLAISIGIKNILIKIFLTKIDGVMLIVLHLKVLKNSELVV
jgi:hypothetical protein